MENWMEDEDGFQRIPHDNGKIKWYVLGFDEEAGHYVGEYDMTDWHKTFDEVVFPKAQEIADNFLDTDEWKLIRKDHLIDMLHSVSHALYQSGDFRESWIAMDFWDDMSEPFKENK
jgi:hypothetical protein